MKKETKENRHYDIVIRENNAVTNDPCAICGKRTDPTGVDLMLRENLALVCMECGRQYAPQLAALLDQEADKDNPESLKEK